MLQHFKKILEILPAADKTKLVVLLAMMLFGAVMEVAGVGMLPVFIAIIATPEKVLGLEFLEPLWNFFSIEDGGDLLIFGAVTLMVIFLIKNLYIIFFRYIESRFVFNRYITIGSRLFTRYMTAPYEMSLTRNTSELLRNIVGEARLMINNVLGPALKMLKSGIMVVGIFLLLLYTEPLISLFTMILLGGVGAVFLKVLKNRMKAYGESAQHDRLMMIKAIQEGLGGLKDITVLNRERWFLKRFAKHIRSYSKAQIFRTLSGASSKPVIETLAVGGMLMIAVILYLQGRSLEVVIPILTLFGAATVRLLPMLQEIVTSYNDLRYYIYSVDPIYNDLIKNPGSSIKNSQGGILRFEQKIELKTVSYSYPNSDFQAVQSLNLDIPKGCAIAFVGASGAGKTTLVDLLLGLILPAEGRITVDGTDISGNIGGWQKNIGYIPQFIFLADDTLLRNVALGLPDDEIDEDAVWKALEAAQLTELAGTLDDGLNTVIGERGVRLSGGQRQRIGIARALYHNPEVLIMDEATSALDNVTEKYVIEAIERFKGERTIIMIAHRLTTVQNCDVLYFMKQGKIVDQGTYNDLLERNKEFQKMALVD